MTTRDRPGRAGERRPHWSIDDVLDRTDLSALLDDVTAPATQTVRGRRWHCPIDGHDDQHASVTMHTDHRGHERWRCWSGDDTHRGDAIDLVMATQHLDRLDALDWLAARAHMIPDQPLPPVTAKHPTTPPVVGLHPSVDGYARACERILWQRGGAPVREWLANRGLGEEVLRANHVGADPGRRLLPRTRGLPHGRSIAAVFPAHDPAGNLRYLQTRYLDPGDGPKYDNPASALGTNPRLAWTTPVHPTGQEVLIICEGIPDALTAAQAGLDAVAVLGAQAPDRVVAMRLATHAEETGHTLIAIPDNDPAGHTWADRLTDLLADHGHDLQVVEPPGQGLDLNGWAQIEPAWHAGGFAAGRQPDRAPARPTLGRAAGSA